ncbi:MAG TPA: tyrosine recombinase XerC [Burkholderiales bacterium]|nr:tyrosine recombinase XerC [Burkholderiales bacterium]
MRGRRDGAALVREYIEALEHQRRLAAATLENYRHALALLLSLAREKDFSAIEAADVRRFLSMLHARGFAPRTLALTLSAWRGCFAWLARHRGWRTNPALGVRAPKASRTLPKAMSVEAAQKLLEDAGGDASPLAVQDRAMFELLYSSGLRLAELVALDVDDGRLDLRQGEVTVTGKGSKSRTVPVGAKARQALKVWISTRQQVATEGEKALFVGARGRRISPSVVGARLGAWARRRGLGQRVHPHMLRHSFASHVLQSSQDLRAVQEMLGHASISTTQIYTHLDFQALAKVYDAAHPRAKKR